jgi:chromosome segregation protein
MQAQQQIELKPRSSATPEHPGQPGGRRERLMQEKNGLNLPDSSLLGNLSMQLEEKQQALEEQTMLLEEAQEQQQRCETERSARRRRRRTASRPPMRSSKRACRR